MGNKIIVSPSGNFYGSEQVLFDYLCETSLGFSVYVPQDTILVKKLNEINFTRHDINSFNTNLLSWFYLKLFIKLYFKKSAIFYLNEAGHIKYLRILASCFPRHRFYVHVRILEDTRLTRWNFKKLSNLTVFTISTFMKDSLKYPSILMYDGYRFRNGEMVDFPKGHKFRVGVIGRVTPSKGIYHLLPILKGLEQIQNNLFAFYLFGHVDKKNVNEQDLLNMTDSYDVILKGFVDKKGEIYEQLDCILHLAEHEPLGRIFFEALDYCLPFIGFDSGGIAELAAKCDLNDFLVKPGIPDVYTEFGNKLIYVKNNYSSIHAGLVEKKKSAAILFDIEKYASTLDDYFS